MLHFNKPEDSKERQETKPLTLEEENGVVEILNESLHFFEDGDKERVQKFLNHYQNMSHHMSSTVGLWATDRPDLIVDEKKIMFQIKL